MIFPLFRYLGVADAGHVTQALGRLRQGHARSVRAQPGTRGFTRRSLVQLGLGSIAAVGLLAGKPATALASSSGRVWDIKKSHSVTGKALVGAMPRFLEHTDVVNLMPERRLQQLRSAQAIASLDEGRTRLQVSKDTDPGLGTVSRCVHEHRDGTALTVTAMAIGDDRLVVLEEYTPAWNGLRSNAYRVRLDEGNAHFEDYSTNGALDSTVGQELQARAGEDPPCQGYPEDDPCGGCCLSGRGSVMVERCRVSRTWDCAFAAASCVGCGSACATGVGAPACVTCLFASCGAAIRACCRRTGKVCSSNACY